MRNILFYTTILCVAFVLAYYETILRLIKGWFTFEYSPALLILAISVFMIWKKKHKLSQLAIKPNVLLGPGVTIVGCLILLSGKLTSTMLIQDASIVFTLLGLILLMLGSQYFRFFLLPLGYLLLMFSLVEELLGNISIYLQYLSALIGSSLLKLIGMPVFLKGEFIELPHITLEVAKSCSGIQHIVALVALAIPLATLTQRRLYRKFIFIVSAFLIGIFANGLRIALIGIWTIYHDDGPLHGPFDIFYVSFILGFGMVLVILTSVFSRKSYHKEMKSEEIDGSRGVTARSAFQIKASSTAIALIILLITSGFLYFYKARPLDLKRPLATFPTLIGQWRGQGVAIRDWPLKDFSADMELKMVYQDLSGQQIGLYIGYFPLQEQGKEVVNDRFNWLHDKAEVIPIRLGLDTIQVKKTRPLERKDSRTLYFWYDINGKIFVDRYRAKLATLLRAFTKRRTNGALVVFSVNQGRYQKEEGNDSVMEFIQLAFPIIRAHLMTTKIETSPYVHNTKRDVALVLKVCN